LGNKDVVDLKQFLIYNKLWILYASWSS
jgi:hypothetical protein